ncbi:BrnA antitoxin family protein [candidate division KSB1 bacterium]|nr:BrnA antitoxin family protein [candidate division KSB1 bacterium]
MKVSRKPSKSKAWDDIDSPPLSDDLLARMEPVKKNHPKIPKRVRGPQMEPVKIPVSIRLSSQVLIYFKSKGKGWQTRINDVLNDYIKSHN